MTYFQLHVSLVVCYSNIHIVGVFNIENELGNPIEHKRNLRKIRQELTNRSHAEEMVLI
jgi:hypothetical protein